MKADTCNFLEGTTVAQVGAGIAGSIATQLLRLLGASIVVLDVATRKSAGVPPYLAGSDGEPASVLREMLRVGKTDVTVGGSALALSAYLGDSPGIDLVVCDLIEPAGWCADWDAYADLVQASNRSAWVSISPFGLTGPHARYSGSDLIALAAGGVLTSACAASTGRPVRLAGQQGLQSAGRVAALAALHGLDVHRRSREPVHVDVSAQEAVIATGTRLEMMHRLLRCPGLVGTKRLAPPSGMYQCADGQIMVIALEQHHWDGISRTLGSPAWADAITSAEARFEAAETIEREFGRWAAGQSKASCAAMLQQQGVPVTPVNTPDDLIASPQLASRGALHKAEIGSIGTGLVPALPIAIDPEPQSGGGEPVASATRSGLTKLRIVELSHVLGVPLAASLLGAMGAQVTRVEDLSRLDTYRRRGPFAEGKPGPNRSAYFVAANFSKSNLVVDSAEPASGQAVREAVSSADVLLENVGRNGLRRLGLDPASASPSAATAADGPGGGRLTLHCSGLGQTGPQSHYRAYGHNLHAYGGIIHLTRGPADELVDQGTAWADQLNAVTMAMIIAAWALSDRQPCDVDLSMAETVASTIGEFICEASMTSARSVSAANELHPFAPHGVYASVTADIAMCIGRDDQWQALLAVLGSPARLAPDEFATQAGRFEHREQLDDALQDILSGAEGRALCQRLQEAGVPAHPVMKIEDLLGSEQLTARGFFPTVVQPDLGPVTCIGVPWRLAQARPAIGPAPILADGDA
jgi:crotonobetainyl-CoA:carnitine CoA-transferase CaiB-like acyl-CoA transferase